MLLWRVDAIQGGTFHDRTTNGRVAVPGTIRGDYCVSSQENIIHTSIHPKRLSKGRTFAKPEELFEYERAVIDFVYYPDEYKLNII